MKPHKLKRVTVKEELVALTGNYISALMLNQFIYWSERTKDADEYIEEEKTRNPETDIELLHGWVYKKADELNGELMLDLSATTIRRYIVKLIDSSLLRERHNPKQKYDRTLQYRPDILEIQRQLHVLGYALEGYALYASQGANLQNEGCNQRNEGSKLHLEGSKLQNVGAIPEITPETTSEITHTRGVCEEKTFGFGIGSSTGILAASSNNYEQKSEESQIVSIGQNPAAVPLSPTAIYRPTKEDEALNFGRRLVPMKGTYASRSSDPWMVDGNNPNPMLVQWVINKKVADQKNLKEAYRSYTPSEVNVKKELRNDYASASDWWQMFLNSVHQQGEIYQTRVAAGIPITADEQNAIASIAPYTNLSLATAVLQPVAAPPPALELPASFPVAVPKGAYGGADIYKVFVAPQLPSEEESLRGRELFIQQTKQRMSMSKSEFKDTPKTEFAKYHTWLHSGEEALRSEAIAWAKSHSNDLDIDYDENGSIINFDEVQF